ncbi:hypothetical protein GQ457_12G015750 [Hibiscus cannabinus]
MSETRLARNSISRGSSNEGDSVGMEENIPRHAEPQALVQPQELVQPRNPEQPLSLHKLPRIPSMFRMYKGSPEEAEYWLERTTQIVTKKLACSDEHKLECAIALLSDEALSWWETTTLTTQEEKVTWKFFIEEFKKKYISDQYLNDRRTRFLHLKQATKPIEQYVVEFHKYCKYGA